MDESRVCQQESGVLLLELMIAVAVIVTGLVGGVSAVMRSYTTARDLDASSVAIESLAETIKSAGLAVAYGQFDGTQVVVSDLFDAAGDPAQIIVTCHVDETDIPAEFGPILDIDGNPGSVSADCSASYEILPVHLSLTHRTVEGQPLTHHLYFVLGDD